MKTFIVLLFCSIGGAPFFGCATPDARDSPEVNAPVPERASVPEPCERLVPFGEVKLCVPNQTTLKGADTLLTYGRRMTVDCDRRVFLGEVVSVLLRGTWGEDRWRVSLGQEALANPAGPFATYLDEMNRTFQGAYVVRAESGFGCPTTKILHYHVRRSSSGRP